MLAARFKDAAYCCDEGCLEHRVIETAGLIGWAQVCGGEGVDRNGRDIVSDVLEVFADGIVRVLECDDVDGIGCQLLCDLDALLCQLEVEVVNVLDGFAV